MASSLRTLCKGRFGRNNKIFKSHQKPTHRRLIRFAFHRFHHRGRQADSSKARAQREVVHSYSHILKEKAGQVFTNGRPRRGHQAPLPTRGQATMCVDTASAPRTGRAGNVFFTPSAAIVRCFSTLALESVCVCVREPPTCGENIGKLHIICKIVLLFQQKAAVSGNWKRVTDDYAAAAADGTFRRYRRCRR